MNASQQSLLNMGISVIAPVLILNKCSQEGESLWHLGTTPALILALALPLGYGLYNFIKTRKADALNLMGLAGVILTALVTIYANTGDGQAIRPDTAWWYAAKEALLPLLLAGAIIATAGKPGSLLRVFIYSDSLFNIPAIEERCHGADKQASYHVIQLKASRILAASLLFSSAANFFIALYFLLPVKDAATDQQALLYNYAIGDITWWGYLIIGVPLIGSFAWVLFFLLRQLAELTGMKKEDMLLTK